MEKYDSKICVKVYSHNQVMMDPYMRERWEAFKSEINKEYIMIGQISSQLNTMKNDTSGAMSNRGGVSYISNELTFFIQDGD